MIRLHYLLLTLLVAWMACTSFAFVVVNVNNNKAPGRPSTVMLEAKRKRRRKQPPGAVASDPVKKDQAEIEGIAPEEEDDEDEDEVEEDVSPEDIRQLQEIAKFEFKPEGDLPVGIQNEPSVPTATSDKDAVLPLPDIKEARMRKQMEEELARMEEEQEEKKVKIKRSDKEAFRKLLEQQPFADADDSYFEEEEYNTVSALLGERAKPFLSIPIGPLQVGHFIGSLGIILMAFIEYPGFPLTNLPTPLRDALQGGLGTVYAINTVLAVLAVFKAQERGQPVPLWVAKTFSVGGLAYDQLTQLPTLEQIEKAKSIKGKRAIKNKKR